MDKTTARRSVNRTRRVCLAGFLVLLAIADVSRLSSQGGQTIGGYELVSQQVQKNSVTLFTYRATLTNTAGALAGATATARSMSSPVKIVDGTLTFGPVGAGGSVVSSDTFSFTRNTNNGRFDWSSIVWTIAATPNHPPVANAGPDLTRLVGQTAQLDGSGSTDADGNPLTYQWSFVSGPLGSLATLSSPTAVNPTFIVDQPGSYVVRLIVNDGFVNSVADTVTVTTLNSAPVANAGPDQTTLLGQPVTLNGSGSSDVDGNALTFAWSFASRPAGSAAVLTNPTSVMPTFAVDVAGTYVVRLVVNDGLLNSAPDTVSITTQNSPPVANAGDDQTVFVTNTVTLDGSGSTDVDGNPLTYAWALISKPAGSAATLSDPTAVRPTFAADKPGVYVAQLVVNDGTVSSAPDTVTIATQNTAPVANAGPDQTVLVGRLVQLDGTASSDVDGDPLSFRWAITSKPVGSAAALFGDTTAGPSFTVDKPGIFVVQLITNDGSLDSAPDTVAITTTNSAPTANAGPDQIGVPAGSIATLNGSQSSDSDGQPLTFAWSLLSKPAASAAALSGDTSAFPTLPIDVAGDYVAQLIVNDGFVDSAPDTVLIRGNAPPVANAGPDQQVTTSDAVHLDASGSNDPDGNPISYLWQFTSTPAGSLAALLGTTAVAPSFIADIAGTYYVQLTVTDSFGASSADFTVVTASSVASVQPSITLQPADLTVAAGQPATFAAAATGIPDPTVQWQRSTDGGATFADVPGATSVTLTFSATAGDDGKKFRAVFSNAAGSALTSAATLTVTVTTDNETVTVSDAVIINGAPLLQPLASQTVDAETDVHFTAVAIDPGDAVLYSLIGAPAGAAIDPATGVFSWTPTEAQAPGTYPFFVLASDSGGLTTQQPITITVRPFVHGIAERVAVSDAVIINGAPMFGPPLIWDVQVGTNLNFIVVAIDPGDAVLYSLIGAPTGATIDPATGVFRWTPTPAQAPGTYPFFVLATDSGGLTAQQSITIRVAMAMISLGAIDPDASETGPDPGVFRFVRSGDQSFDLNVNYSIDGTATNGDDYAPLSGTIVFPAGQAFVDLAITPVEDSLVEPPETVVLTLVDGPGYVPSDPTTATVTIADVHHAAFNVVNATSIGATALTVTFDAAPNATQATTASNYFVPGLAITGTLMLAGNTVTLATSVQSAGLAYAVYVLGVTRASDGEPLGVSGADFIGHGINAVSVEALDPNASEVGPDPGTVRFARQGDVSLGLVVGYSIAGTATNGVDYQPPLDGSVIFQPGETFRDVTIAPVDDVLLEGSETVVLSLIPDVSYFLGATTTATVAIADSALAVTNTNDSGIGSLRQAVLNANAHSGVTDTISFNIPGGGVHTITLLSPIPTINDAVAIDGTTQPGYAAQQPVIEIDGSLAGPNAYGLLINATGSAIRGLIINRFGTGGSGNIGGAAIVLEGGGSHVVQGNFIGTDPTGSLALPNRTDGILIAASSSNLIGGTAAGQANTIAFNGGAGVLVDSAFGNTIQGNAIFSNAGLGIDLGRDGVTPNDAQDVDEGANGLQNFPNVTSALSDSGTTSIQGTLNSWPLTQFSIEFFANAVCSPSGYGQGALFLGSSLLSTDATGNLSFDTTLQIPVATGQFITATATRADGSTSEFSACVEVNPGVTLTPDTLNLLTRDAGTLSVTLTHPAGVGGVAIALSTSDAAVAAIPSNVAVPEGATTATFNVTTGTSAGTATIAASTSGFSNGTSQVVVSLRTMALSSPSPLVAVGHNFAATINLAQPAPQGGVTIALASSDGSHVSVTPSSVTIAEGDQSATFTISGLANGPATITASADGFASATLTITATTSSIISLGSSVVVAPGLDVGLPLSLGKPAPAGGVTVFLSSSNAAIATVTPSVFIPEGLLIPAANPLVHGLAIGSAQITGSAVDFAPDTANVTVTISIGLAPNPLNVIQGQAGSATLTLSSPAPAGGLTFDTSVDNTSFATVPATVHVDAGATSAQVPVTAVAIGDTTLHASAPGITQATTTVSVKPAPSISIGDATIGKDLQVSLSGTLGAPAPAGNLQVTITSLDPGKVLLATSPTAAGAASIVATVNAGASTIPAFYVQALTASGAAAIQTTAPGYTTDTSTITFQPSGFYLPTNNFTTTAFSANTPVSVSAARLDPITLNVVQAQAVRGGLSPVSVDVTSSNRTVGTIENSPAVFLGGDSTKNVEFNPAAPGTTAISLTTPAGFTPVSVLQQITATVESNISVGNATVGKDLQVALSGTLGTAPAGNLQVTITSLDPGKALLTANPAAAGAASITLMVGAGSSTIPTFYVQALVANGTADIETAAPGYTTDSSTITFQPSGFYVVSSNFTTTTFAANTPVFVGAARLDPSTLNVVQAQAVRGGLSTPISVAVTSSDTTVGAIEGNPAIFTGGEVSKSVEFNPAAPGTTAIDVAAPAGFSTPGNQQQITATVESVINIGNAAVGKDLQVAMSGTLGTAPAGNLQVTVTSLDPSQVALATSPTGTGAASISLLVGAGSSTLPTFYVQALAGSGNALLEAAAPGYTTETITIALQPSGFYITTGDFSTTTFEGDRPVSVSAARLDPQTLTVAQAQALRGSLSSPVSVTMTSSDPAVGAIVDSPAILAGGDVTASVTFDPLTTGTTTISVMPPVGFATPGNAQHIAATVSAPDISIGSVTVGRDLQTTTAISLAAAPPSPVTVTVTSNDAGLATITTNGTIAGGTTLTFTNVTSTSVGTITVQGRALGSTTITVRAPGYNDGTGSVAIQPSGFYLASSDFTTTAFAANTPVSVSAARLDPTTLNVVQAQAVRGGLSSVNSMIAGWPCASLACWNALPAGSSSSASCSSVPSGSSGDVTVSQRNGPWLKSAFLVKPSTSV